MPMINGKYYSAIDLDTIYQWFEEVSYTYRDPRFANTAIAIVPNNVEKSTEHQEKIE